MFFRLITILATLATLYNDWRARKAAEEIKKEIERDQEDEADKIREIVTDIRNDPDLSDELLINPKDRSKL